MQFKSDASVTAPRAIFSGRLDVAGPLRLLRAIVDALLVWQQRAADRRHLQELDDRLLRDMGLSRADVAREAAKPFWRP